MPSLLHESLVELVQQDGQLACELLRGRTALPQGELVVESVSADFTQVVPTEYRADQVLALRTRGDAVDGQPALIVVVEVQLSIDARKERSWPVYVTTAARRHNCNVVLLVISPDEEVARWARGPFGPSADFMLHPIVISYADVPEHLEEERARRLPELAVLRALAHPRMEIVKSALDIVRGLPSDRNKLYSDMIMNALEETSAEELQMIEGYQYQSKFARKCVAEGRLEAFQRMALELAGCKLGELPEASAAAIGAVRDDAALSALVLELGQAQDAAQARAALERVAAAAPPSQLQG